MTRDRIPSRVGAEAFAAVDADIDVDEVLARFEETTLDDIIALADEPSAADVTDEEAAVLEAIPTEAPERVETDDDEDEDLGGPSMDELFGERSV